VHLSFASFESVPSFSRRFCPFTLRVNSFGPAAPSMYSRQDFGPSKLSLSGQQCLRCIRGRTLVPRSHLFRASSAFDVFEAGLWSLEVISFGPAAPSMHSGYSKQDFGPSSYLFRASSALEAFEAGLQPLGLSLSG
jgi:hypothetical protein